MRWIVLLGRIGTVLFMVGLALALVSLIPPVTVRISSSYKIRIMPKNYWIIHSGIYTPQAGVRISVESNNSVYVYLLGVSRLQIEEWTRTWVEDTFPDLNETHVLSVMHNVTVLDEVLQTHLDIILWKSALSKDLSHDFFPSNILNVTAIIANPSLNYANINTEIEGITALAPRERVIGPAQWLILIGIVLAIPCLILNKTKKD